MIIDGESRKILHEKFKNEMKRNVVIYFFTSREKEIPLEKLLSHEHEEREDLCRFCDFTRKFLKELEEISMGKITVKEFEVDSEKGREFKVERVPTLFIDPENGYKIKYVGSPIGEETWAFIDTIILVSKEKSSLSNITKEMIKNMDKKANIKVFITPSCPYCPYQVIIANNFAIESKSNIESECINVLENSDLAEKYNITAVPYTLINEKIELVGVQSEQKMLESIFKDQK